MSKNRETAKAVVVVVALIFVASLWSRSVADDGHDGPDKKTALMKAIERRMTNLEKVVGPTPTPVAGRIDVLEKGLRDLTLAMGGTAWSSVQGNLREAKKKLAEATRIHRQQDEDLRQLKQVDKRLERIGNDPVKLHRAVDGMDRRLHWVESRS